VKGVAELNQWVDSLLVIDNERVRQMYGKLKLTEAFGKADDVLGMATKGIAELITVEKALVRVDFADVNKVMRNSGRTHMSMVKATGENRAMEVAEAALTSSLLDDNNINGAKEILINFSVKDINTITQDDITIAMDYIQKHASYTDDNGNIHAADIIWGASQKPSLADDELELVVVATRFTNGEELPIETKYTDPEPIIFTTPAEPQPGPKQPNKPDNIVVQPPHADVIITPQQDKYRQVAMQKREPAYIRQRAQFEVESDSQQRVNYQREEHSSMGEGNGTLQF
jgi:cell division protein FtsZ